MKEAIISNCL